MVSELLSHSRYPFSNGRFTRPLRAFVSLLNARQMLLRVGNGEAWPQRKVHGDRNGRYGDSEWPAVLAAHRQLSSPVDLDTLDEVLAERYRRDTELRAKARDTLILRIRAGLPKATKTTKHDAILRIVELQSQQAIDDPDDDDRQLTHSQPRQRRRIRRRHSLSIHCSRERRRGSRQRRRGAVR
jgi:hypothetical protein